MSLDRDGITGWVVVTVLLLTGLVAAPMAPLAAAPKPLAIATSKMPSGQATAPYRLALKATGGTTPYTWSIASGVLPVGLQLAPGGLVTGTPSATGSSSVTVRVRDKVGQSVTKALMWKVVAMTTWSMDGRDAGHSMRNLAEVSLRPDNVASLKREWTADTFFANASVSSVVVDASGVNITRTTPDAAENVLDIVDPARGKVVSEIRSAMDSPNLADGRIVVRDASGHLQAYDQATHELLWSTEQTEATARLATPVIDGTTVFARGSTGNEAALYAFNAATGVRRWKIVLSPNGGAGFYAPSVGGGNVFVADGAGLVQARSEQGGGLSWKVVLGPNAPPDFTPSYLAGTVYVPASTNVRALDAATGSEKWHSTGTLHPNSGIAVGTTQVFFTTYDGDGFSSQVVAVGMSTHAVDWSVQIGIHQGYAPTYTPGLVWVGDNEGGAYALQATDGAVRWSASVSSFSIQGAIVVVNGRVFVRGGSGEVAAFGLAPTLPRITSTIVGGLHTGRAFSHQLTAASGAAPYTWAVTSGSLPAGLTLSPAGRLSGTPTAVGTSAVTVRVTDKRGGQDARGLRIDVNDPGAVDWPNWMSGEAETGANLSESTISRDSVGGLTTAWSTDVTAQDADAQGVRGVVVAGSTVYVTSPAGTLTALATNDGAPRWQKTGLGNLNSAPAVVGDTVYVLSTTLGQAVGQLVAFPTSGGTRRWSVDVPLYSNNGTTLDPSPLVAGNLAYVPGGDGKLYAFHTSDGSPAWNAPVDDPGSEGPITGTPALDDGRLFFGTGCDLYAVDSLTGSRLWRATYSDTASCEQWIAPTVAGGAVVDSGPFSGPTAFDVATGHVLWSHPFNPRQTSSGLSTAYGAVYGSTNLFNGAGDIYRLVAFDAATGDVDFSTPIGCYCRNPATVANGMVFLQENQAVSVYDADTGDLLTTSPTFGTGGQAYTTPVVIAAGRVYAGADDGTVIAFHT